MKLLIPIIAGLMICLTAYYMVVNQLLPSKESCQEFNLADSREANEWVGEFQKENNENFLKEISIAPGNQFEQNRNSVNIGHSYMQMTCGLRFTDNNGFLSQLSVK